jgi:hypothetical protein
MITAPALVSPAQKMSTRLAPSYWEDTAINPHDFNDDYYARFGIEPKSIIDRRTGTDFLSVFGPSSNPAHSKVRVLATLPAYGPNGEIQFWYPLGELPYDGFTQDKMGVITRETAMANAIYVFPLKVDYGAGEVSFNNSRQAALIGPSQGYYPETKGNPAAPRIIVRVNYTPKAYTKEAYKTMEYMMLKNGVTLDKTPVICTFDDIQMLWKEEMITLESRPLWEDPTKIAMFAITPVIADPTKGAVAKDAFLLMSTLDGTPLPSETMFVTQFKCLQERGSWCTK